MLKVKEACAILGLNENTGKDDIVKRYDILLKKYRAQQIDGSGGSGTGIDIEKVNEAYNVLMGYKTEKDMVDIDYKENPLLKKIGVDEKKTRNFLYYYKYHILISIISVIVIAFTVKGCVTRVEPDLNIAFIGNFYYGDTDALKNKIRSSVPGIKEPGIDGAYITEDGKSDQAYAMQMKAMVLLAAGDVDIYIVDKANFTRYAKQGAFLSLDELAPEIGIDREKNKEYILKIEDKNSGQDNKEHLYGFDAGAGSLLKEPDVVGKEKIAAISIRAKHNDNAIKFLKQLLK